ARICTYVQCTFLYVHYLHVSLYFDAARGLHVPRELRRRRGARPRLRRAVLVAALPGGEQVHRLLAAVAPRADGDHAAVPDGGEGRHRAAVLGQARHRPPRGAAVVRGVARREVAVAEHVHRRARRGRRRGAARPRARPLVEDTLLHGAPRPRGRVERLGGAGEPALRLRRVPADGDEPAADADAPGLVPLRRHVRERHPRVGLGVVRDRRPQRVLLLVVPAGDEHPPPHRGAREERPPRSRHRRAAPPRPGQEVVHVHRVRRRPRLGIPPADHHQPPPLPAARRHRGELAEERQPTGAGERRQRGPAAGDGVVEDEAVGGGQAGVLVSRAGGGERRLGLGEGEERARHAAGPAEAVVERRLDLRLPPPRRAPRRRQLVESHAQQAFPGHFLR
ncbi:Os02g0208675, partial [Oryza sativa Japonica Group]